MVFLFEHLLVLYWVVDMYTISGKIYRLPFVLKGNCPPAQPPISIIFKNWITPWLNKIPKDFRRDLDVREIIHWLNYLDVVSEQEAQKFLLSETIWWNTFGDDLPKKLRTELRTTLEFILNGFEH